MPVGASFLVASCGGNSGLYRNYAANARLIAAAPELLEALQNAVDDLIECAEELQAGPMSGLAATIAKARAAIKKATA